MSKVTLSGLTTLTNESSALATINNNNNAIIAALENTLSRDGTSPNPMAANLDMDSNQIINLPVPGTANSPLRLQDLATFVGGGTVGNVGKPFFILSTGQSNFVLNPSFAWTPETGAKLWNFSGVDGNVGTAFSAIDPTTVNITWKIASEIAKANPSRPVYLLNVAFSNKDISHWLSGASSPDIYQNILNNITHALSAAGVSQIDLFLWWQGEADATIPNANYIANWNTMIQRFWGNTWFPQETPIVVHGLESIYGGYISNLVAVVNADPDKRRFVYTSSLAGATYWDASNPGHMTGQGYFSAGAMSASAYLSGPGRNSLQSIVNDPTTGYLNFGPSGVTPSDPFTFTFNGQITAPGSTGALRTLYGANGGNAVDLVQAFGGAPMSVLQRYNGTYLAPTKLLADDFMSIWGSRGYDSAGQVAGNKGLLSFSALGDWTAPNHGTYCSIWTTTNGTDTTTEAVRIRNGAVIINGTTSGSSILTAPAVAGTSILTLPVATDTLVGKATTDILTNKTLTAPVLTTPALGTPASGVLTSCTGLPLTTGITGNLPVANGGTGATANTGTGNNVLATSPVLVTPNLGTPTTLVLTSATGLPLTTGVTGALPRANGGGATSVAGEQAALNIGVLSASATGVNFNSANTDTAIPITLPTGYTRFIVFRVNISHPSAVLTTSTFGMFSTTGAGGFAIITGGTANTISTIADATFNNAMSVNGNFGSMVGSSLPTPNTVYFRVGTAQGSAATADVTVEYFPLL